MNRHMITFARENVWFALRVAGVAIHDGHVLLHRAECDDFWALPGGRAELLEPAAESLIREMQEEVNYYRLKAGSLGFRLPLRSSRLKVMRLKAVVSTTPRLRRFERFTDNERRRTCQAAAVGAGELFSA
jgi:8-oxo-dGTP pyrophosphatase MutT (NUDIX family)